MNFMMFLAIVPRMIGREMEVDGCGSRDTSSRFFIVTYTWDLNCGGRKGENRSGHIRSSLKGSIDRTLDK
jgi:hypothetical protein